MEASEGFDADNEELAKGVDRNEDKEVYQEV